MHAHTSRHSPCSLLDPVELVLHVQEKGLQGIILTEHHYLWQEAEIADLRRAAEVNDAFIIVSGQEVSVKGFGHVLVFGADKTIDKKHTLESLRKLYPEAALIWAHPFRNGHMPLTEKLTHPYLDGVEIFSMNHTVRENYHGLKAWHTQKFTALSGSDAHTPEMTGCFPTEFMHPVETINDIAAEIRAGRCHPFFKEIPKKGSNILVNEITIGTKGVDETRSRIIVKKYESKTQWAKEKRSFSLSALLYEAGFNTGTFRVPRVIEIDSKEQLVIEEGQRGKHLLELLKIVQPLSGKIYFYLAAGWLARLHNERLANDDLGYTIKKEKKRFESYLKAFRVTNNPRTEEVAMLISYIKEKELKMLAARENECIQNHGDYHPKNIIIGYDRAHDITSRFISVIDFGSTLRMLPSFDVGYFLAQYDYQMHSDEKVLSTYTEQMFVDAYHESLTEQQWQDSFMQDVLFFKIRSFLSIAAFLIKVGKGESPDMDFVLSRALEHKKALHDDKLDKN